MLEHHIERKHPDSFKDTLQSGAKKVVELDTAQTSISGFVLPCPTFEEGLLN
jgi:hypothetical protein